MLDNVITLYHYDGEKYTRAIIPHCFYSESYSSTFSNTGMQGSKTIEILIRAKENIEINDGFDMVVLGTCTAEITNTSEETISNSIKILKSKFKAFTIQSSEHNIFGGLSNVYLTCI